jgi:hypothetical protein
MKIVVLLPVGERHKKLLEEKAPAAEFLYLDPGTMDAGQIMDADIILGNPPVKFLKNTGNLKWVQLQSAGV